MLKKSVLASVVFMCAFQANAECVINFQSTPKIKNLVTTSTGWTFNKYAEICQKINAANALFYIFGSSAVLDNKSIGWASISIKDKSLPIFSTTFRGEATLVDPYASQDKADKLLLQAVNDAIEVLDLDKALMTLERARKEIKTAYGK